MKFILSEYELIELAKEFIPFGFDLTANLAFEILKNQLGHEITLNADGTYTYDDGEEA